MQGGRWLAVLGMTLVVFTMGLAALACGGNGDTTGDEHEADEQEAEHGLEENAYLEVAAKDALFLVEMTSFAFTPDVLEVNAEDVIEIAIQNADPLLHDFTIDEVDADVHISYLGGTGDHLHVGPDREADIHFALTERGTGIVHVKVSQPGEYVFYCSVPGHREAGMEGTLIVR